MLNLYQTATGEKITRFHTNSFNGKKTIGFSYDIKSILQSGEIKKGVTKYKPSFSKDYSAFIRACNMPKKDLVLKMVEDSFGLFKSAEIKKSDFCALLKMVHRSRITYIRRPSDRGNYYDLITINDGVFTKAMPVPVVKKVMGEKYRLIVNKLDCALGEKIIAYHDRDKWYQGRDYEMQFYTNCLIDNEFRALQLSDS